MKKQYLILLLLFFGKTLFAQQFAPQVGFQGTTAIYKDSSDFVAWATDATITRGYKNILSQADGYASFGQATNAIGQANNTYVSLGDSGEAILSFEHPIINGDSYDFAIFENGFLAEVNAPLAFLELAFVAVSTDGVQYIQFPAISHTSTSNQLNAYDYIDATYITNFAGKYIVDYGTPFDLEDLATLTAGTTVNLSEINYVKITDVTGVISSSFANQDSEGNTINDPFPTAFSSGGFDLDALGVIHQDSTTTVLTNDDKISISLVPNPTNNYFKINSEIPINSIQIYSSNAIFIKECNTSLCDISELSNGMYIAIIKTDSKTYYQKIIKK